MTDGSNSAVGSVPAERRLVSAQDSRAGAGPFGRRTIGAIVVLVFLGLVATGYWFWDHRHYWIAHHFRAVEAGKIYAGGYQFPAPMRRLLEEHQIKTVLSLLTDDDEVNAAEQQLAASAGVRFLRISVLRGEKLATRDESIAARLATVEEAVEVIADPENQPILVHCRAGKHRTGAVVAVYRVKYCGWTEPEARAELKRWGGFTEGAVLPSLVLHAFCSRKQP